jgi:hypothetical protein
MTGRLLFGAAALALTIPAFSAGEPERLGSSAGWKIAASDGVEAASEVPSETAAFRVRFDFHGEAGYLSERKPFSLVLPDNYEISFRLVGQTIPNDLQLKLLDSSGDNVWWFRTLGTAAAPDARRFVFRKGELRFAWGPAGGGEIREVASVEFALAAGEGGRGWLEIRDLELTRLPVSTVKEHEDETPTELLEALARRARRGDYPRCLSGEQAYWTIVGTDGGPDNALLGEDGAIEAGRGRFSLEPFIQDGATLLDWSGVSIAQSLEEGDLPIPSVTWTHGPLSLRITAFGERAGSGVRIFARYRLRNRGNSLRRVRLFLAVRPFQVNPPRQFLAAPGGFSPIHSIAFDGEIVHVNGRPAVIPMRRPDDFAAGTLDGGPLSRWLLKDRSHRRSAADARGFASGVLAYDVSIPARGEWEADCAIPLAGASEELGSGDPETRQRAVSDEWREKLGRVDIRLSEIAGALAAAIRSSLADILLNREGAALQPGPRSYRRAWIRDGSIMAEALLRLGHTQEARGFLDWYADRVYPAGKVPCCIDVRGRDPVPENDSSGEFLFLAAEYVRHTGDRAWLVCHWDVIERVVAFLNGLRERPQAEAETPLRAAFCGMLQASISHEGYSSNPVHSFWDDFFAVRGLKDAVEMAEIAGRPASARRFAALRDEFRRDLRDSLDASIRLHGIDFLPGSVELGDFDPTSTAIAISIAQAENDLPRPELETTFDLYIENFRRRRSGLLPWDAYTPYEIRIADALVRLGQKERAQELLAFFLKDRRPLAWNQWPEVVWRDARAPNFLGDLPHAWVGAEFVLAALDLLAFERESDGALVLGAGVIESWARAPGGISLRGLSTRWGALDYQMQASEDRLRVKIGGGLRLPPGGVAIRWPLQGQPGAATVNGRDVSEIRGGEVIVRELPAEVEVRR